MIRIDLPKTGEEKAKRDKKWTLWTNTTKPFDPNKPFHRINCPTFKEEEVQRDDETEDERVLRADALRADGRGFDRGCKVPIDVELDGAIETFLDRFIRDPRNAIRAIPGWVAVDDGLPFQEIEGILLRSYQTWTDVPLFQWHRWYDWNLFMNPAPGYGFLRGRANRPPEIPKVTDKGEPNEFLQAAIRNFDKSEAETMECEIDCGLFGSRLCETDINPIESSGPMFEADLAWPLAGQYAWATGRWIYDCGHPTTDNKGQDVLHLKGGGVLITGTFQEETKSGFLFEFSSSRKTAKVLVHNEHNSGSLVAVLKDNPVVLFGDLVIDTINGEEVTSIDLAKVKRFSKASPNEVVQVRLCEGVQGKLQEGSASGGRIFRGARGAQDIVGNVSARSAEMDGRTVKSVTEAGLTRSELHPTKAVATARWEAAKFDENGDNFVPAIQFMFFATIEGGYRGDIGPLNAVDYEFIVDLPLFDNSMGWPIGKTSEFPLNTGTLRKPELLTKFDFTPFEKAINKTSGGKNVVGKTAFKAGKAEPIITPISLGPDIPPMQANVRIPLKSLPPGTDYYGVIVSLGWHDPTLEEARRVKKITVKLVEVEVGQNIHDSDVGFNSGEWQVRIGVNGRWIEARKEGILPGNKINNFLPKIPNPIEFFMADDGLISIAAHGEETDLVHDVFRGRKDKFRIFKIPTLDVPIIPNRFLPGTVVDYEKDCVRGDDTLRRKLLSLFLSDQTFTFAVENDPLGRLDPYHSNKPGEVNPIPVSALSERETMFELIALPTAEVGKSAELAEKVFDKDKPEFDYLLRFTIKAEAQKIKEFS